MADSIPVLARRMEGDGVVLVAVSVSGERWFERLMLQAGQGVSVLMPPELRGVAAGAAARTLARYQPTV